MQFASRYILLFICILLYINIVTAQTGFQFTQYPYVKFAYNPAYAGIENNINLTAIVRNQWVGIENAPATQYIGVHMPISKIKGGLGINILNERLGLEKTISANMAIAYHKHFAFGKLSMGINAGIIQKSLDGTQLRAPEGDYQGEIIVHNDTKLPLSNVNNITPDAAVGLHYESKKLNVGISLLNILQPAINYSIVEITLKRQLYMTASYNYKFNDFLIIKPATLIRTDLDKLQADISIIGEYNNFIHAGLAFRGYNKRSVDGTSIIAGINLNKDFYVGYAYDLAISPYRSFQSGSHEVLLNYKINFITNKNTYEPRYF
jgi:type IX secretion system PorP/SprF family membrane protein